MSGNPRLSKAADIATIGAAVVVSTLLILRYFDGQRPRRPAPAKPFSAGQRMTQPDGVDFSRAERTLVVFVRSTCGFCTASMPFYRSLAGDRSKATARVQLVGVCNEPVDVCANYLRTNGLELDQVFSLQVGGSGLRSTPTLVLVGRDGKVVESWVGQLPAAVEGSVRRAVLGDAKASASVIEPSLVERR